MAKINLLDELTANQIAAGEVIERPSSVVKELVENSLDAGADKIVVEIIKGGLDFIKISDNGIGMSNEDVSKAIKRHATSKISSIDDLNKLKTLGFRGEALPSVTSVAKVIIITRENKADSGTKIIIEGNKVINNEPVGTSIGTLIEVRDLFFNTPARKKFLRSEGYESGLIHELLIKFSLSNPQVSFCFIQQGKEIMNTIGINTIPDLLEHYYGDDIKEYLVEIDGKLSSGNIRGYITLPTYHRVNRKGIDFFINGRRIYSKELLKALEYAYENTLPKGRFPISVLELNLDPSTIDVNVHPNKLEVRLRDDTLVRELTTLIKDILSRNKAVPQYHFKDEKIIKAVAFTSPSKTKNDSMAKPNVVQEAFREFNDWTSIKANNYSENSLESNNKNQNKNKNENKNGSDDTAPVINSANISQLSSKIQESLAEVKEIEKDEVVLNRQELIESEITSIPALKVIGQLAQTFILAEGEQGLYILDQHVAHERIIYENLLEKYNSNRMESQILLEPISLQLTLLEEEIALKYIMPISDMGIILELFGPRNYLLRSVPVGVNEDPKDFFYSLLQQLANNKGSIEILDIKKKFLILTSCKSAIKAKMKMSQQEMEKLIDDLSKTKNAMTCPHGRPIIFKVTYPEILKAFRRI